MRKTQKHVLGETQGITGDCHIENWLDLCLKERPSNDGVQRYPFSPSFPHPSEGGMVNSCTGWGGEVEPRRMMGES